MFTLILLGTLDDKVDFVYSRTCNMRVELKYNIVC